MDRLAFTVLMGSSETNHPRQQLSNELANLSTVGFKRSFTNAMKSLKIEGPGFGTIRAGATERANVDLTQELVDLITGQRNFQASAKAIETNTTLTQAIINIRS